MNHKPAGFTVPWSSPSPVSRTGSLSYQQHLDRDQVDEDEPLVLLTLLVAAQEGEVQRFLGWKTQPTRVRIQRRHKDYPTRSSALGWSGL